MRINNNLQAMNTHRQLGIATTGGAKSMEKLSSGFRINRAGDDAAGLAISEKMRGQIRGLTQASRNAQDGISLIQTAEGALNETHAILQRMRELAVQSSTDTNTDADRAEIQKEVNQLTEEITRIAETTQFNTMNLLDGNYKGKKFHIGANEGQNTTITIADMAASALGLSVSTTATITIKEEVVVGGVTTAAVTQEVDVIGVNVVSQSNADKAITLVDTALGKVSSERSKLGAMQNRLEHTIKNLDTSAENLQASEARIRDVDMAKEMMEQTKQNILQQASTAMLAQANQAPQNVLQLLR